jgi:hypothetical protein
VLKRVALAATATAAIVVVTWPAAQSGAAAQGGCSLSGAAKVSPGLTTEEQAIKFSFTGLFDQCQGVEGVTSGKVKAAGKGTGSCGGNTTKGAGKIVWNNGKTSLIKFATEGHGVLVDVTGKITKGLFKGTPARAELVFQTDEPQACLDGGVTNPTFDGLATLGF